MFRLLRKFISDFIDDELEWLEYKREMRIYKRDLPKLRQLEILEKLDKFDMRKIERR